MVQVWNDLLFAHWPFPPAVLRPFIPAGLTLDTYEGQAWLGVVPFWMNGLRARLPGTPVIPVSPPFNEINVRTYVQWRGESGVFFFSLDADNVLAVIGARLGAHLPYFNAQMAHARRGTTIAFTSRRRHPHAPPASFAARYRPISPVFTAAPGSLPHWLVERYRLFTPDPRGDLYRIEVRHHVWPLQEAAARIRTNTMGTAHGVTFPDIPPVLHYIRRLPAYFWPPERL
jgi:uncharacterized protein YqjF (DUF2071 family)